MEFDSVMHTIPKPRVTSSLKKVCLLRCLFQVHLSCNHSGISLGSGSLSDSAPHTHSGKTRGQHAWLILRVGEGGDSDHEDDDDGKLISWSILLAQSEFME